MPVYIVAAFLFDLALGLAYVVVVLIGTPVEVLIRFIDLDREKTFATWFASVQLFTVAALLWIFAAGRVTRKLSSWSLIVVPVVFAMLSLDEVTQLHEYFGVAFDRLLLEGPRAASPLARTGVWFIVLGVPLVILLGLLMAAIRPYVRKYRGAFAKLVSGTVVLLAGAIGVEALANFVPQDSFGDHLLVLIEEMLELTGATVLLWGSYELVQESRSLSMLPSSRG